MRRKRQAALFVCLLLLPNAVSIEPILSREVVERSSRAIELCFDVQFTSGPADALVYVDEPDKALFLKEDDVCWGVFRGTEPRLDDWLQNLNQFPEEVCSQQSGACCTTRQGYVRAYQAKYTDELEKNLRDCASNCPECEVILTGHSQGGAVAAGAGILLEELDPTIITFGQPATITGPCPPIEASKYFRFRNTLLSSWSLLYDLTPFLNSEDDLGHVFLIGDDPVGLAYYGDEAPVGDRNGLLTVEAHDIAKYMFRFESYLGHGVFPLGTNGWSAGFACTRDSECVHRCVDKRCSSGLDGDRCKTNVDCESHRCEGFATFLWPGECESTLGKGEWCNEDSDCDSQVCEWWRKCK